jgi:hypothetical protein
MDRQPRWELWIPVFSAVLCASAALWWSERLQLQPFDDAYITLRAALNWATGQGPVFNPGERVESTTSPLWTALLALGIRVGADPVALLGAAGVVFTAAAGAMCSILALRTAGPLASVAAGVFLAALPTWSAWALTGMEVPLAGLALAIAAWGALRDRPAIAGVLAAAAALARPEALILVPLFVAAASLCADQQRRRRTAAIAGVCAAIPLAALFLLRHAWFGAWLPNTYVAKRGGLGWAAVARGLRYATAFAMLHPAIAAGIGWAGALKRRPETFLALVCGAFAAAVAWEGGDHFGNYRLLAPILPIACALCGIFVARIRLPSVAAVALCCSAVLPALIGVATPLGRFGRNPTGPQRLAEEARFAGQAREAGEALAAFPPGTVATPAIGAIGYYSRRNVLDLVGLADARVAQSPHLPGVVPGHDHADVDYVLSRRPALALFIPQLTTDFIDEAAEERWLVPLREYFLSSLLLLGDARFQRAYTPIVMRRPDGRHLRVWVRNDLARAYVGSSGSSGPSSAVSGSPESFLSR